MAVTSFDKELGGAEDLLLDADAPSTVSQTRASGIVSITKINADTIPYSGAFGDVGMVSIKDKLDTKIDVDGDIISTNANGSIGLKAGPGTDTWTGGTPLDTEATLYQVLGSGNSSWVAKFTLGADNVLFKGTVGGDDALLDTDFVTKLQMENTYIPLSNAITEVTALNKVVTEAEVLSTLSPTNQLISQDDLLSELNTYAVNPISGGNKILTQADGVGDSLIMIIKDVKTSGIGGGTFTSGAWRTRDLNTIQHNSISGASLATNQITLPAGTYEIDAESVAYRVDSNQLRIYDITAAAEVILGETNYFSQSGPVGAAASAKGIVTFSVTTTIEVQHYCLLTHTTNGFGYPLTWGNNIYSQVIIRKI